MCYYFSMLNASPFKWPFLPRVKWVKTPPKNNVMRPAKIQGGLKHRPLFYRYWNNPHPILMLTLGLSTTLRQCFRPKYYTRTIFRLKVSICKDFKVVPVLVKQWPVTCVFDPPAKIKCLVPLVEMWAHRLFWCSSLERNNKQVIITFRHLPLETLRHLPHISSRNFGLLIHISRCIYLPHIFYWCLWRILDTNRIKWSKSFCFYFCVFPFSTQKSKF